MCVVACGVDRMCVGLEEGSRMGHTTMDYAQHSESEGVGILVERM